MLAIPALLPTIVAATLLLQAPALSPGSMETEFEAPRRPANTADFAPGTSALDAWAALRDAEGRSYSLAGAGLRSFSARVNSPQIEALADSLSAVPGRELDFVLWWAAPDLRRVTLKGSRGELSPEVEQRLVGLVEPLLELLVPVSPAHQLRSHAFVFVETPAIMSSRRVVEARARTPDDPRRLARFTINEQGLVVRQETETSTGETSDYHYAHVERDGLQLLVGVTGRHRGSRVDLTIHWSRTPGQLPLPTRVTARQLDALGRPEGALGEIEYRLSEPRVDEPTPDWVGQPLNPRR